MTDPDLRDLEPTRARLDAVGREERREREESWAAGPAAGEEEALAALSRFAAESPARPTRRILAWGLPLAAALALVFFVVRGGDPPRTNPVLGPNDPPVVIAPSERVTDFSTVRWTGVLPARHEWVVVVFGEDGDELTRSDPMRGTEWEIPADRVVGVQRITVRVLVVGEDGFGTVLRSSKEVEAWL